ncbi:MAG: ABC transporter permease [Cryomorphaceae bacterium]|jgi:ABC-type lipoprotein release transport system permease subunit
MLKLAWRNIWRNKGRSVITIAAVMFCVIFAVVLRSFQVGVWENMIHEIVGNNFGYLQIHEDGFWADQSLDRTMDLGAVNSEELLAVDGVDRLIPRMESFSLLYHGSNTKGSLVMGIDPAVELPGLQLDDILLEGRSFSRDDSVIVVSEGLAKYFNVGLGDTLLFMGQGYHGATAYGAFPIGGIARMTNPELNKQLVLMPLQKAQYMYNCTDRATTLVVAVDKDSNYEAVGAALKGSGAEGLEVLEWKELFPEIIQTIEVDMAGGRIFVTILYFIISFVLLGTVIMMVAERQREFGILVSIGMKKTKLAFVTLLENIMLIMGGAIVGMAVVKPVQFYFKYNPIDLSGQMKEAIEQYNFEPKLYTTTSFIINLNHGTIIFIIGVLVSLYAVVKIMKLNPIESMRS